MGQSDFHLFRYLKEFLGGKRFDTADEVKEVQDWLSSQAADVYEISPNDKNKAFPQRRGINIQLFAPRRREHRDIERKPLTLNEKLEKAIYSKTKVL
ncbi:hypothetical protein TNCV_1946191 [Trichonephila clavipes]|uniref:Uncharacterized protein n=1 Tax=Trichonephila clavipes TaxID=2585209 RepID=A0A8X6VK04_TRICX|nr:hypothetical protein TNCV_1946191 [Trichonephila clavipes]